MNEYEDVNVNEYLIDETDGQENVEHDMQANVEDNTQANLRANLQANTQASVHSNVRELVHISEYLIDESLDIPINVSDVNYGNVSLNVIPKGVSIDDFEVVSKPTYNACVVPTSREHDIKAIMELITDKPKPPPKKPPTLMDQLPSMRAIMMTSKDLANKLPYAKEVKEYVKEIVPPAKSMWSKLKKNVKAPLKIYNNYVNSFTYSNEVDYG